jgi:large subunit ribosomal protein L25
VAENILSAENREGVGKGVTRKLRAAGRIPGVIYGKTRDPQSISLDPTALEKLLRGAGGLNTLIDLSVGERTDTVLVKELQRHPVRGAFWHVDFYQVDLSQKITVDIPLHFVGKAKGVEFGGILDHPLREIEVECLPRAIPEFVEVDVSALEVGDSIHVSELQLPDGVEVMTDGQLPVASVVLPAAEVEETPTEEAAEGEAATAEGATAEGAPAAEDGEKGKSDKAKSD